MGTAEAINALLIAGQPFSLADETVLTRPRTGAPTGCAHDDFWYSFNAELAWAGTLVLQ